MVLEIGAGCVKEPLAGTSGAAIRPAPRARGVA